MIEHLSVPVRDFKKSEAFYIKALKPLGYKPQYQFPGATGFAEGGIASFWIVEKKHREGIHVAFLARTKKAVHAFHEEALKAGGKDNGGPGFREEYSPDYYGALILDLDGNNIEAVYYDSKKQVKK